MGWYNKYILPKIVHCTCSTKPAMRQREKIVPLAGGVVLEIGIGTGLNLPYYDASKVVKVLGLDPSREMTRGAQRAARAAPFEVEFIESGGEAIPLEASSVDTVLITYTLCTIADAPTALRQMARVLKRSGTLIFCEHGLAPDPPVRRWQHRIEPIWKQLGGGCHLTRPIPGLIEQGGFRIAALEKGYIPGWKPATFNYWGTAARRN